MTDEFMVQAIAEARASYQEGGLPIGSLLVKDGRVLGRGRNMLYQNSDPTGHAEMEAYRDAARRAAETHTPNEIEALVIGGTVYTTMMPCEMCAGAIIRFQATRVVFAETRSYRPSATQRLMEMQGIEVVVLDEADSVALVETYYAEHPDKREAWMSPCEPDLQL